MINVHVAIYVQAILCQHTADSSWEYYISNIITWKVTRFYTKNIDKYLSSCTSTYCYVHNCSPGKFNIIWLVLETGWSALITTVHW